MANYHLVQQRGAFCNFPHQSEMHSKGGRYLGAMTTEDLLKQQVSPFAGRHGDTQWQMATT